MRPDSRVNSCLGNCHSDQSMRVVVTTGHYRVAIDPVRGEFCVLSKSIPGDWNVPILPGCLLNGDDLYKYHGRDTPIKMDNLEYLASKIVLINYMELKERDVEALKTWNRLKLYPHDLGDGMKLFPGSTIRLLHSPRVGISSIVDGVYTFLWSDIRKNVVWLRFAYPGAHDVFHITMQDTGRRWTRTYKPAFGLRVANEREYKVD